MLSCDHLECNITGLMVADNFDLSHGVNLMVPVMHAHNCLC